MMRQPTTIEEQAARHYRWHVGARNAHRITSAEHDEQARVVSLHNGHEGLLCRVHYRPAGSGRWKFSLLAGGPFVDRAAVVEAERAERDEARHGHA